MGQLVAQLVPALRGRGAVVVVHVRGYEVTARSESSRDGGVVAVEDRADEQNPHGSTTRATAGDADQQLTPGNREPQGGDLTGPTLCEAGTRVDRRRTDTWSQVQVILRWRHSEHCSEHAGI